MAWSVRFQGTAGLFLAVLLTANTAFAGINEKIGSLPGRVFCVNAGFETAWDTTITVLDEFGMKPGFMDPEYGVITTAFASAGSAELRKIAANARFFRGGQFSLKIVLEPVSADFTRLRLTLQMRQGKLIGSDERLLKSRGTLEKFLAHRINQLALARQFPSLYEYRLGFHLEPDLAADLYRIRKVEEDSPAGEAGFKNGDWLLALDGETVTPGDGLFSRLLSGKDEKLMTLRIKRDKTEIEMPLWVIRVRETKPRLGLTLHRDKSSGEFRVFSVEGFSPAEKAGILPGDILVRDGDMVLDSWTAYYRALARQEEHKPVRFQIKRLDQYLTVVV